MAVQPFSPCTAVILQLKTLVPSEEPSSNHARLRHHVPKHTSTFHPSGLKRQQMTAAW